MSYIVHPGSVHISRQESKRTVQRFLHQNWRENVVVIHGRFVEQSGGEVPIVRSKILKRNIAESEIIQLRLRGENFLYLVPDVVQTHLAQIKTTCCKFDDEVPFMWPRETRPDLKRSEVGLGGVKFVHVVNDREIRISRPDIKSDQTPWGDGGTDTLLPSLPKKIPFHRLILTNIQVIVEPHPHVTKYLPRIPLAHVLDRGVL